MGAVGETSDADNAAERKPIRIEVENFGPIREGSVDLKPLTVFIGPNNSGKSYMAMLVNALFEAHAPYGGLHGIVLSGGEPRDGWTAAYETAIRELVTALRADEEIAPLPVPDEIGAEAARLLMKHVYEELLHDAIARGFGCEPGGLVRSGQDAAALTVHTGIGRARAQFGRIEAGRLVADPLPTYEPVNTVITTRSESPGWLVQNEFGGSTVGSPGRHDVTEDRLELAIRAAVRAGMDNTVWSCFAEPCHYVPATRSGIMQVHRPLAAEIVEQATATKNGISARGVLNGATADFVSMLLRLEPSYVAAFADVVQQFEHDMIRGEVVAEALGEFTYPTISYRFDGMSMPLHRASSTVSELAPILLMLKHVVAEDDVLIIEEPEAHLHPANQAKLAHLLVRLVRRGLRLIITTHSDYLLEQLGNFVMLSGVSAESRKERHGYAEDDYLTPDEVGVHLFRPDEEAGGHVIEPVTVDLEDGIYLDEFLRVNEVLYDETIRIRREILDE